MTSNAAFARWAALPNLAVLDTETTGLTGEVIELALVDRDEQILFEERFKPRCRIEAGAQAKHGIADGHLVNCRGIEHHWPRLRELLDRHTVVIYNRSFDTERLRHSLSLAMPAWRGQPEDRDLFQRFLERSECAMWAYVPLNLGRKAKLTQACDREGVRVDDLGRPHGAVGDALRTLRLIRAVAEQLNGGQAQ